MKKILKTLLIGGAVLALAGTAGATDFEINIYGASAQHKFWNAAAPAFLTTAAPDGPGCSAANQADYDKKHGITRGINCNVDNNGGNDDTVYIRYSSKASYDGIYAVKNLLYPGETNACSPNDGQREMAAKSFADGGAAALECADVTLGASDVSGAAFTQSSSGWDGQENFPSGDFVSRSFTGIDTAGLGAYNPVVVPFGFYASNDILVNRCEVPVTETDHMAYDKNGWACDSANDCTSYYKCIDVDPTSEFEGWCNGVVGGTSCEKPITCAVAGTACVGKPIDNLTKLQAVLIFSGAVNNWSQFGTGYPDKAIVRCMRHAGSGTHATLDKSVFLGTGTGPLTSSTPFATWHHTSSTDLVECVDANQGAIGYADADKLLGTKKLAGNVHYVKFEGVEANRNAIRQGLYNFWAAQYLYFDAAELAADGIEGLVSLLNDYASTPANLAALDPQGEFWATQDEMKVQKVDGLGNSDDSYYPSMK